MNTAPMSSNTTDIDLDACLRVATDAAIAAGKLILAAAEDGGSRRVEQKGSHVDLVTDTDRACEDLIRRALAAAFPDYAFIGEESSAEAGELTDAPTWMVRSTATAAAVAPH